MKFTRTALIAVCALVLALLAVTPATNAFAAGPVLSAHTAILAPALTPTGCPAGDMCIYNQTNGKDLCIATPVNEPNLGACTRTDESVFNNGFQGNPNNVVAMNFLGNYRGAWTCIARGSYWLFTNQYTFNAGPGTTGYGYTVEQSVGSFHWQAHDCGNSKS